MVPAADAGDPPAAAERGQRDRPDDGVQPRGVAPPVLTRMCMSYRPYPGRGIMATRMRTGPRCGGRFQVAQLFAQRFELGGQIGGRRDGGVGLVLEPALGPVLDPHLAKLPVQASLAVVRQGQLGLLVERVAAGFAAHDGDRVGPQDVLHPVSRHDGARVAAERREGEASERLVHLRFVLDDLLPVGVGGDVNQLARRVQAGESVGDRVAHVLVERARERRPGLKTPFSRYVSSRVLKITRCRSSARDRQTPAALQRAGQLGQLFRRADEEAALALRESFNQKGGDRVLLFGVGLERKAHVAATVNVIVTSVREYHCVIGSSGPIVTPTDNLQQQFCQWAGVTDFAYLAPRPEREARREAWRTLPPQATFEHRNVHRF